MRPPLLQWQLDQIEMECALLQGHATDPTCPCDTDTENCERKHLLTIEGLAKETYPMLDDEREKQMMFDLADQARAWRKEVEQLTINPEPIEKSGLGVGGEPRYGQPKTEAEREATHEARFSTTKTPERGSGQKGNPEPIRIERGETTEVKIYKELPEFHEGSFRTIKPREDLLVVIGCPIDTADWIGGECLCHATGERGCTEIHSLNEPIIPFGGGE
ncbi:hypothetical protein ES703_18957 [subsurface metagenome]